MTKRSYQFSSSDLYSKGVIDSKGVVTQDDSKLGSWLNKARSHSLECRISPETSTGAGTGSGTLTDSKVEIVGDETEVFKFMKENYDSSMGLDDLRTHEVHAGS